jgi:hypothetical protein
MTNLEIPHLSPVIDVGLNHTETASQSNQTGAIDMDIDVSDYGDSQNHQSMLEEASDIATYIPSTQAPVFFDSDPDDSDDEDRNDQDQESRLETETPPGPRNNPDPETECSSQSSEHICTTLNFSSDGSLADFRSESSNVPKNQDPAQFIVKFPGAGDALGTQASKVGYRPYVNGLGTEVNQPLEWAPFSTRLEWEVARWAKLRGPSSTALSELLKIDGVS